VEAAGPCVVRLYETAVKNLDNARLVYRARIRTENVQGQVYLEMWLRFPEKGRFFSRGLDDAVSGTNEWVTVETPFLLQKGENPDLVQLNLVVGGKGMVWIDDMFLLKEPLH
jgi:hypothetical protein